MLRLRPSDVFSLNGLLRRQAVKRYLPTVQQVHPRDLLDVGRMVVEEDAQLARRMHAALTLALQEKFPTDEYYGRPSDSQRTG